MIIAYIIAGVIAYFIVGVAVVGVGEAILNTDGGYTYTSNDNSARTFFIICWPLASVVIGIAALCIGIAEGYKKLSNRYWHGRYSFKQIIFSPGEAARRLACATQARFTKE